MRNDSSWAVESNNQDAFLKKELFLDENILYKKIQKINQDYKDGKEQIVDIINQKEALDQELHEIQEKQKKLEDALKLAHEFFRQAADEDDLV